MIDHCLRQQWQWKKTIIITSSCENVKEPTEWCLVISNVMILTYIYIFIREVLLIYWCVIQDNTRLDGRLFLLLALSCGTFNEKPYRYFFRQNSLLLFSMSSVHWQRLHFFWCMNNWTNLSVVVFLKYSLKKKYGTSIFSIESGWSFNRLHQQTSTWSTLNVRHAYAAKPQSTMPCNHVICN